MRVKPLPFIAGGGAEKLSGTACRDGGAGNPLGILGRLL